MSTEMDLEGFRRQARAWLRNNMELKTGLPTPSDAEDRQLQAKIADAGYAGLPYPVEYGGRGPDPASSGGVSRGGGALPAASGSWRLPGHDRADPS